MTNLEYKTLIAAYLVQQAYYSREECFLDDYDEHDENLAASERAYNLFDAIETDEYTQADYEDAFLHTQSHSTYNEYACAYDSIRREYIEKGLGELRAGLLFIAYEVTRGGDGRTIVDSEKFTLEQYAEREGFGVTVEHTDRFFHFMTRYATGVLEINDGRDSFIYHLD